MNLLDILPKGDDGGGFLAEGVYDFFPEPEQFPAQAAGIALHVPFEGVQLREFIAHQITQNGAENPGWAGLGAFDGSTDHLVGVATQLEAFAQTGQINPRCIEADFATACGVQFLFQPLQQAKHMAFEGFVVAQGQHAGKRHLCAAGKVEAVAVGGGLFDLDLELVPDLVGYRAGKVTRIVAQFPHLLLLAFDQVV